VLLGLPGPARPGDAVAQAAQAGGAAREEVEQAHEQLAALVGEQDAQRCAEDASYQPAWLRE